MNILITGATGFIGSHLVAKLIAAGHTIIALKRKNSNTDRITDYLDKIITYDLDEITSLEEIFQKESIHCILHLATNYLKQHTSVEQLKEMNDANITFPAQLVDLAVKYNVSYFINTGTCFEYELISTPINEHSPINPYNYYASTKVAFEAILRYYAFHTPLKALTLKLFYPYGEKDNRKLIPIIMESFVKDQSLELTKGEQTVDFTYVHDIVSAYEKAIAFICSDKYTQYEAFNIASHAPHSIKQIVAMMEEIANKKTLLTFSRPYPDNEIMYMDGDNTKAKQQLDWEPHYDLKKGLTQTYNYYINHL